MTNFWQTWYAKIFQEVKAEATLERPWGMEKDHKASLLNILELESHWSRFIQEDERSVSMTFENCSVKISIEYTLSSSPPFLTCRNYAMFAMFANVVFDEVNQILGTW